MRTLSSFRDRHRGASVVVCGCGESLNALEAPERFVTIGVNDVGRRFTPRYLVVVNPRNQFTGDRFRYVEGSKAEYVFTQLALGLRREGVVRFRLGSYGGTNISNLDTLDYTQNSPYVALCLAAHMGARRVGLIGVDFTDHHFFARTGRHALAPRLASIDAQYRRLGEAMRARGIEVYNLSAASRLTAFPRMTVEAFAALSEAEATRAPSEGVCVNARADAEAETLSTEAQAPLRVVSYATTPVAGVPAILARCVAARTPHAAACVWARRDYGNGVRFEGGLEWTTERARAEEELSRADLVVVHNGKVEPRHRRLLAGKAVVTMAHNYKWNVDETFVAGGFPGIVVGQYQAALAEFDGWAAVPNPVPLWEPAHQPDAKGETVTVCYTPSGRHERYPEGHRLYWHSKGYATTMRVLERLAARYTLRLEVIGGRQVSHAESLAMKRRSHIVIDECVTGSYHRNSLEGLAAGCVVVNGLGLRPEIEEVFRRCAPGSRRTPFVRAGLDDLEAVLTSLVEMGAGALAEAGAANRLWMEEHWDFRHQWEHFWVPAVARALGRAGRAPTTGTRNGVGHAPAPCEPLGAAPAHAQTSTQEAAPVTAPPAMTVTAQVTARASLRLVEQRARAAGEASREGVSVVVPHGGAERLRHLEKTLRRLREVGCVLDVAVVEMDERPHALGVARVLADSYAFIKRDGGVFHKARAMNAGVPLAARGDVVLWLDNDLLLPTDFLPKALAEMHSRRLDCLVPWTSVRYLSREETTEVFAARRTGIGDCEHVNAYYTRQGACGGAVLVRREFLRRAGGMCEGFRGWGGEDNAWFYRARVLGAAAVTGRPDQHLYHLHHENSGGYDSTNHLEKNPHYDANVALLYATRRVRSRAEMLKRFPAPRHLTCPWDASHRVAFVFAEGDTAARIAALSTADALEALYGLGVERVPCGADFVADEAAASLRACDAVVAFGEALALSLLRDERLRERWARTVVAHVGACEAGFDGADVEVLARACAHFSFGAGAARALEASGLDCWRPLGGDEACEGASDAALGLAQPLSLAVAGAGLADALEPALGADTQHTDGGPMDVDFTIPEAIPETAAAREADLSLTEFAAFNHARDYPRLRRWELPFALFKARLSSTASVLDCSVNPSDFGARLQSLYPHALYRHRSPASGGEFAPPLDAPDEAFDRAVCVNTLEHLRAEQRGALLAEMAHKLKPGGLLVVTCEYFFDDPGRVAPDELAAECARHGLSPFGGAGACAAPSARDAGLYLDFEPRPHAAFGAVFVKEGAAPQLPAKRKVVLALLTWNTRDISLEALAALAREAGALRRLGQRPFICVCDNGSTDGTPDALREASERLGVEHRLIFNTENRGSSVARNQIIDYAVADCGADYLLFTDGDIELVPFSSFAMLRHMEDAGHLLGCLGAHMYGQSPARAETTPALYSLGGLELRDEEVVAWTQYGMFRREVFDAGVRFDDAYPFDREGWGCEDNDLAFQLLVKGYRIRCFAGMTYLHRNMHSSVRILRALGHDPRSSYETRKRYVVQKWSAEPSISAGPLRHVRVARAPTG